SRWAPGRPRAGRPGGSRGGALGLEARGPLVLEEVAQVVPGAVEGDPGDDGLEEAEHDELASLVGRDAAALEVEQLGRVDWPDRRGMRGTTAVGLVDLERR